MTNPDIKTVLIMLPLFHNPDANGVCAPIEEELFFQTAEDIAQRFGGGLIHKYNPSSIGFWWDKGVLNKDEMAVLEVDIQDSEESRQWLRKYLKDVLTKRFKQKAMYLKLVGPVETMEVATEEINEEP